MIRHFGTFVFLVIYVKSAQFGCLPCYNRQKRADWSIGIDFGTYYNSLYFYVLLLGAALL